MEVFHLKYRPKIISELDLKDVALKLKKNLSQKNPPHSFLFSGPKGIGKTSSARILAKALNCPNIKNGDPCGKCDSCLGIEKGQSLDIIEIDAASNRGIDDIRNLKEKIGFQPFGAKNKVYIVDEVHMLTNEAFNAILKTLEEPPAHVYFVFCTTNPEKIPPTVLSRLTIVEFRKANTSDIVNSLLRVVKGEEIKVDASVLETIAANSEGSFRDAHKTFHQLYIETGKKNKISIKEAKKFLKDIKKSYPGFLLDLLLRKEKKQALLLVESLAKKGIDFYSYQKRILEVVNEIILAKYVGKKIDDEQLLKVAQKMTEADLIKIDGLINTSLKNQKISPVAQLPLEIALLKFLTEVENVNGGGAKTSPIKVVKSENIKKNIEVKKEESFVESGDVKIINSRWGEMLEAVKPMNHSVSALLRSCHPSCMEGDCLVLEVFYEFHKDKLSEEKNRQILENGLKKVFGKNYRVKYVLGKTKTSVEKPKENTEDDLYDIAKEIFGE